MAGLFANIDRKSAERAAQREVVRQQALIDAGLAVAPQTREQQQTQSREAFGSLLGTAQGPLSQDLGGMSASSPFLQGQNPEAQASTLGKLTNEGPAGEAVALGLLGQVLPKTEQEQGAIDQAARDERIRRQREGLEFSQDSILRQQEIVAGQSATFNQLNPTPVASYEAATGATLPPGMIVSENPFTGRMEPRPAPNTPAFAQARAKVAGVEDMTTQLNEMLGLIEGAGPTGTDQFGGDASGLEFQYQRVMSSLGNLMELGVLQQSDLERLGGALPNPTGAILNFRAMLGSIPGVSILAAPFIKDEITRPYETWLKSMQGTLEQTRQDNWYVRSQPGLFPGDAGQASQ